MNEVQLVVSKQTLKIFLYRILQLIYQLADVLINDIKWTKHGR